MLFLQLVEGALRFQTLLVVVGQVAVFAHAFRVVGLILVLALRGGLRVALLMVARTAHVLCAMLFLHVLANELLVQLVRICFLEGLALELFVL